MERIVAAAIKVGNLVLMVERPGRHHNVFYSLRDAGLPPIKGAGGNAQGFITSHGRFVGREEARQLATAAGQLLKSEKDDAGVPIVRDHPQLFSEDVW